MAARGRSMIWLGHDTERGYRNVFRLGRTGTSAPAGFSPMQHGGTCEGSGIMTLERRHARMGVARARHNRRTRQLDFGADSGRPLVASAPAIYYAAYGVGRVQLPSPAVAVHSGALR